MCGNFGLVMLPSAGTFDKGAEYKKPIVAQDSYDQSLSRSMHSVCSLHGLRMANNIGTNNEDRENKEIVYIPLLKILQSQISATEIRGGQAGGISCLEYANNGESKDAFSSCSRVRCVARKRFALAEDLVKLYLKQNTPPKSKSTVTFVGHTRFATASMNRVPELHPHEWMPFQKTTSWSLNQSTGRMESCLKEVGIHISHNGDFDAIEMYNQAVVVGNIGLWLERVLHTPNDTKGDSPKIAGCLDLFRVQGLWGPAARLAYIRCILKSPTDVCGGEPLSKEAPNTFPIPSIWEAWEAFFESLWVQHHGNIVEVHPNLSASYYYAIDAKSEQLFVKCLLKIVNSSQNKMIDSMTSAWTSAEKYAFIYHTVRGFLRGDLYCAMTELLSKAEGSFGLQAHSSLEPGVVILASKGQPMSLAFDPKNPLCLYGSEAEAVAVPIDAEGSWLPQRFDLDSHGEIVRVGAPRALTEGNFLGSVHASKIAKIKSECKLLLRCGVEIRVYSLVTDCELTSQQIIHRSVNIISAPIPYNPKVDLVAVDLAVIPATLSQIDKAWKDDTSIEYLAADSLCNRLVTSMHERLKENTDNIDLLIGGVEASLWVAEQWAADVRTLFPYLNIVATSANKLLSLDMDSPDTIYFPGSQLYPRSHFSSTTCVLLISQSGQTFPTLHATRKVADLVKDRLWLLTGCFQSKMELALLDSYHARGEVYWKNRVFNNYTGNRPAEPTSIAIAATHHSLTYLLLHLVHTTRNTPIAPDIAQENSLSATKLMTLPVECDRDLESLLTTAILPGLESIVGYDINQEPKLPSDGEVDVHQALVSQGKAWAEHVREPWRILVYVFVYITVSVGLGLPLFGLLGDALLAVLQACGVVGRGHLSFSPRSPHTMYSQSVGFTLIGLGLQIVDAIWFVFLAKIFTWIDRWISGRPIWARHGKRTLVIVDSPMVHQLTETFVSKLFSQSYSFCSIDVHGASGLDHFVHRFTHRVARGLLLAVGRPDGRLCCLAKSECAVLLSTKQAVFIQNPDYVGEGSGPDIVTVGHNSYVPNLGLAKHVVLSCGNRSMFVDEVLFEQLSEVPHSSDVVRPLLSLLIERYEKSSRNGDGCSHHLYGAELARYLLTEYQKTQSNGQGSLADSNQQLVKKWLHAEETLLLSLEAPKKSNKESESTMYTNPIFRLGKRRVQSEISCDPSSRLAFSSSLDSSTQRVLQRQRPLQQLYEGRVAALERYIAFCVMFHAMAKASSHPWFRTPWDVARSQSNLRVATTACPVTASDGSSSELSPEVKRIAKKLGFCMRGFRVQF